MKKFKIPMINKHFILYSGEQEFQKWSKEIKKHGCKAKKEEYPGAESGRAWGGWLWVGNIKNRNLLLHETAHVVYDLILCLNAEEESEFFAYISAYVYDEVLKYADSLNNR